MTIDDIKNNLKGLKRFIIEASTILLVILGMIYAALFKVIPKALEEEHGGIALGVYAFFWIVIISFFSYITGAHDSAQY